MSEEKKIYLDVPFSEKNEAKMYGARFDFEVKKWYYIDPKDKSLFEQWLPKEAPAVTLSDEQQAMVDKALAGENVLVDACIGSGKTTAIQELCNQMPTKNILYLTYNTLLKVDAKAKISQPNTTVTNYHGFAAMCLRQSNIKVGLSELIQAFNSRKPELVNNYDVLIIDEYQDIESEHSEMLKIIKEKNPGLQIIAVGDMQQKIYDKTTLNVPEFMQEFLGTYTLLSFTQCFRLNAEHAQALGEVWHKKIVGVNPKCSVRTMPLDEVVDYLKSKELSDILCLGTRNGPMSSVLNALEKAYPLKFNKNTVYATIRDRTDRVTADTNRAAIFTTYDASKGLERKICCVFDFDESLWNYRALRPNVKYEIIRNIFCVAASRGKEEIIFVYDSDKNHNLLTLPESLENPTKLVTRFADPFNASDMFDFVYNEDREACYNLLKITPISTDKKEIKVNTHEGLIDISPCIGIWQESSIFKRYDIDDMIIESELAHKNSPKPYVPKKATLDQKILILTALETGYFRYVAQVSTPFLTKEQKEKIIERLRTEFDGNEIVQQGSSMYLTDHRGQVITIQGNYDVYKNNKIYELKFKTELEHKDFLQLAFYLLSNEVPKGILWNVKNNEKYEVSIPAKNKKKFLSALLNCITKGVITKCSSMISASA